MNSAWESFNLQAEQSLLGALMILGGNTATADRVFSTLKSTDFYRSDHREYFSGAQRLHQRKQPTDLLTLLEEVGQNHFNYLGTIAKETPSAANIHGYAQIIKEKALERNTMSKLQEAIAVITDNGDTSEKLETILSLMNTIDVNSANANNEPIAIRDMAADWLNLLEERINNPNMAGMTTGIPALDALLGARGINITDLIVLGSRPKVGKTQFAIRWASHVGLVLKKPVVIFSMEMAKEQVLERYISQDARLDTDSFYRPLPESDYAKLGNSLSGFTNADMYIDDRTNLSLSKLRYSCRKLVAKHGRLGLIVVDYLTLMPPEKADRTDLGYGLITKGLKNMAKDLKSPVLLVAQLNRSVDARSDKRPRKSDFRETGQIEQDADRIILLYREQTYNYDSPLGGLTEVILDANRHGPIGTSYLDMVSGWLIDIEQAEIISRQQRSGAETTAKEGVKCFRGKH
ncbi:MAG: AAA family ATPase [Psychrobium sp.]|nr:AAA family ATPase [Psychrobium sp.]